MCVHFLLIAAGIDAVCADLFSGSYFQGQLCVILIVWFNPREQPSTKVLLTASLTLHTALGWAEDPNSNSASGLAWRQFDR